MQRLRGMKIAQVFGRAVWWVLRDETTGVSSQGVSRARGSAQAGARRPSAPATLQQTAPIPGVPSPVCFSMNQSFEAPARRKSWVLDSEGSWAEGWVWLSVGKAQSDPVTAGWGLGVLVPKVTQPLVRGWHCGISWLLLPHTVHPPCLCW